MEAFSQKVKAKFKDAVKFINNLSKPPPFWLAAKRISIYVICDHIHHAEIREGDRFPDNPGKVLYLKRSGDWVKATPL